MKFSRFLILAAALLVFSGVALADTVTDPVIGVKGCVTSCSTDFGTSQTLVIDSATFISQSFSTQFPITSFLMVFSTAQATGFSTLAGSIFTVTDVSPEPGVFTEALLTGGTIFPAPPPCTDSCIGSPVLLDSTSNSITGAWNFYINGGTGSVSVIANPVPEPGTMILLGSGLGALALRRRRKSKAS